MNIERYILSPTAKKRRKTVQRIEYLLMACFGIGVYILTGLALRWLGVA